MDDKTRTHVAMVLVGLDLVVCLWAIRQMNKREREWNQEG